MNKKEFDMAWKEFCDNNSELLFNHSEVIMLAFKAGWLAGKCEEIEKK